MSVHNQLLSALAWQDEEHVVHNRTLYRQKYESFEVLSVTGRWKAPPASFYLWPEIPAGFENDEAFAKQLIEATNIKVLPGSYLSRTDDRGINPGAGRVRMALVATSEECLEGAHRLGEFVRKISGLGAKLPQDIARQKRHNTRLLIWHTGLSRKLRASALANVT